jgi:hypothetical protein
MQDICSKIHGRRNTWYYWINLIIMKKRKDRPALVTRFTGARIKSEKPYLSRIKNAAEIHVSDYCPNAPFQPAEAAGYQEVSREEINTFDFKGKSVWYRRSTTYGRSKVYVKI